jgi:hypothetical protein
MTDPSESRGQFQFPLSAEDIAAGEQYAEPHDPGPEEQYAGDPVPDPWEEAPDGDLDPGPLPGQPEE